MLTYPPGHPPSAEKQNHADDLRCSRQRGGFAQERKPDSEQQAECTPGDPGGRAAGDRASGLPTFHRCPSDEKPAGTRSRFSQRPGRNITRSQPWEASAATDQARRSPRTAFRWARISASRSALSSSSERPCASSARPLARTAPVSASSRGSPRSSHQRWKLAA